MNYRKVYMQIISAAKNQQKLGLRPQKVFYKKEDFQNKYFEFHHILPRSLFPNWKTRESNVVPLTAREHFFCHQLLTKIYPSSEMFYALWRMCCGERLGHRKVTSREWARIRESCRKNINWKEHGQKVRDAWNRKTKEEKEAIIRKHLQSFMNRTPEEKAATKAKELQTKLNRTESQIKATYEKRLQTWKSKSADEIAEIRQKQKETFRKRVDLENTTKTKKDVETLLAEMPFVKITYSKEYQKFLKAEISYSDFLRFLKDHRTPEQLELQKQQTKLKYQKAISNWSEEFKEDLKKRQKAWYYKLTESERKAFYEKRDMSYIENPERRKEVIQKRLDSISSWSKDRKQQYLEKWRKSFEKTNEERKRKISETLKSKTPEQKLQKKLKEAATRAAWSEERKLEYSRKRSERQSKYVWWNNGVVSKMSETQPAPDFVRGRLPFKKKVSKN